MARVQGIEMRCPSFGRRAVGPALLAATMFLGCGAVAVAQTPPAPSAAPAKDVKDERALSLLKGMSTTLVGAKTISFSARSMVPFASPTGQYISLFALSRVVMQRPDRLYVETRGDLFPNNLTFKGKTLTAVTLDRRFYAQREVAGASIDAAIKEAHPGSDALAPFIDLLTSDPYSVLTSNLSSAVWIGQSTVGGVKTEHLAFTAKGVDWEIWIGADKLPRLMVVSFRAGERQPTFTVEFQDWKLNAQAGAQTFSTAIPKGATRLEFRSEATPQTPK